jgi:site-specific DNA-methyltransferase (adenine-specific)
MKFDVIIGNPPYQMSDGSGGNGSSAIPLYHKFVQQAKRLNPKYITMIIPSRWFSGGRNLDEFRDEMLNDKRLKKLTDFLDSKECFPGNNIEGGVCYFLWDASYRDDCYVTTISQGKSNSVKRPLLEENCETFIRHNEAISILKKIRVLKEKPIVDGTLKYNPFGIRSSFKGNEIALSPNDLTLYGLNSKTFINSNSLTKNNEIVSKYKICVGKAYGMGTPPYNVINSPFILNPNEICTETYLVLKTCDNLNEAKNIISYINTRFFRFLVSLKKISQNSTWSTYLLVPTQDFSKPWTDEDLYKKYGLTQEEIDYIESMIRPIDR